MFIWTPTVLSVLYACVSYFCICTCSAQLSMLHMERRSRNTLIIIIIIFVSTVMPLRFHTFLWSLPKEAHANDYTMCPPPPPPPPHPKLTNNPCLLCSPPSSGISTTLCSRLLSVFSMSFHRRPLLRISASAPQRVMLF